MMPPRNALSTALVRAARCMEAHNIGTMYRYSRSPLGEWAPPHAVASASGFYENLLLTRLYWQRTIQNEGLARLSLLVPKTVYKRHFASHSSYH